MPKSPRTPKLLLHLKAKEDLSIVRGLGSLAFIRAQGRTLEKRSQEKVLALLWSIRGELESLRSAQQFDKRHHAWVKNAIRVLRTNRNNQLAYGQGQKTINVFLKFYVDWASCPTADVAARLRPWLHCPLDRVIMEALRSHDVEAWRDRIWNPHKQRASMASINEPAYRAWQYWIRELSPEKPVLVDALWSLVRPMNRSVPSSHSMSSKA
jgi:hypothetical protein